jgi:S1-C subfamily serine protease
LLEKPGIDHSVLYIIPKNIRLFSGIIAGDVYIANQSPFNIYNNSTVAYKIYSEGEISIAVHLNGQSRNFFHTLKAKRGNAYYLYLTPYGLNSAPESSDVLSDIKKLKGINNVSENNENPINPKSIGSSDKKGQGSCFLISKDGYLVTNFHCVENSKEIFVRGIGGDYVSRISASVVATNPSNDLALLKVNSRNVAFNSPVFSIRSSGIQQGEKVYALGYPFAAAMGEDVKITDGIISSLSGVQNNISEFQISAAVNPGNSGGPLIDENGNLIGVIYAKSKIAESAGYAIKAAYLEAFLKNVPDFTYPVPSNSIKDKPLPEKVKELRNFIYIVETN